MLGRLLVGSLAVSLFSLVAWGCAAPEADDEDLGSTSSKQIAVGVDDVMARAQEWVDQRVPYCGGVRGGHDAICGGTCDRPASPARPSRS